jgi:hypothetical protein
MIKHFVIINISIVLICFSVVPSLSFTKDTRRTMIKDAITFCPPSLQTYLNNNMEAVKSGMCFVDNNLDLKIDPYQIKNFYSTLLTRLNGDLKQEYNTASKFGLIACFIAETINPYSLRTYSTRAPQASENEKVVVYDGYQKIFDITKRIEIMANNYKLYYSSSTLDKAILDQAYSTAVNEIVDYWVST